MKKHGAYRKNQNTGHVLTSLIAAGLLALLVFIGQPAGAFVLLNERSPESNGLQILPTAEGDPSVPAYTAPHIITSEDASIIRQNSSIIDEEHVCEPVLSQQTTVNEEAPSVSTPAENNEQVNDVQSYTAAVTRKSDPAKAAARVFVAEPNGTYTNMLSSVSDVVRYEFTLTGRGALQYSLEADADELADWNAKLYQEYYVNGNYGETALRHLNTLSVPQDQKAASTPHIGLHAGRYCIEVTSGGTYAAALFRLELKFTAGTDFEIEYNDSVTRYTEIWPNVAVRGSACSRDTGRDTDWYMLHLYNTGGYELQFTHAEETYPTVAFKLYLYNSEMQEIYSGNSFMSSASVSSGYIGLPPGIYYIQVQSRIYTGFDYTLTVKRDPSAFESEPNDSFVLATSLTAAQPLHGALTGRTGNSDRDYYAVTFEEPGYTEIYMQNLVRSEKTTGYIRRLTLLDAAGHTIYKGMITDRAAYLRTPVIGVGTGTYYLCVDNDNLYENSGTYEIGYSFTAAQNWESEYNNQPEYATPLTENAAVSGTLSDAESEFDTDWFVFAVDEEKSVTLAFAHEAPEGQKDIFNITLYGADGTAIGDTLISFEDTPALTLTQEVNPGTYYVKVTSGRYNSNVRYSLTYSFESEAE